MSEIKGRCRAAIGLLEAARGLVESAGSEAGKSWSGNERDCRTVMKCLERIQQRLILKHDAPSDILERPK